MAGSDNSVELIKERLSLSEIIGESVALRQSGSRMTGLCPFHREKTPSFFVSDDTGSFNCFGCGKSGDIFTFVMETKGMTFVEALRYLAGRAGVELKQRAESDVARDAEQREEKSKLREIAFLVQQTFQVELDRSDVAKKYLSARGISDETVKHFKLGFSPNRWHFLVEALMPLLAASTKLKDTKEVELQKLLLSLGMLAVGRSNRTGSAESGEQGEEAESMFDFLRNRVIFPISRSDGLPVAFGGRTLSADDKSPKYLNTKETPLYQKRRTLYGLAQSLPALRRSREALLVEGYFDLISLYQSGFRNVLGSCGTAFTADHAKLISRFASRVQILFDGDSAGRKAAASCFEIFINTGVDCSVVKLPEGEDPDTLARKLSREQLDTFFAEHSVSLPKFYLEQLKITSTTSDLGPAGLGALAKKYSLLAKRVANPVEREALFKIGADELGISPESLMKSAGVPAAGRGTAQPPRPQQPFPADPGGAPNPRHSSPPPSRGKQTSQPPRTDSFIAVWRQAVVASLCDPSFAESFVDTATDLSRDGATYELSLDQIRIIGKVRELVTELADSETKGIFALLDHYGDDEQAFRAGIEKLAGLLSKHGLMDGENTLLREALQQAGVGAAELLKVVEESGIATVRILEKRSLSRIRKLEGEPMEDADRLVLAQRKLEERRKSGQKSLD